MKRILICGSSGFIGSNLVDRLQKLGHYVIGVDIVEPVYSTPNAFYKWDMRFDWQEYGNGVNAEVSEGVDEAYCLACLMGGMGYIGDEEKYGYDIAIGSTQIIIQFIEICKWFKVPKVFYSSSACVYNQNLQTDSNVVALKESDAIPASPDLLYGWQKLYAEKMFEASGLNVRIARFHNVFGKWGSYNNQKEKAPAAICRKVAMSKCIAWDYPPYEWEPVEVWGTGKQTRSFLHIDEALEGVERLMGSNYIKPLNIGSDELISINQLAEMIIEISGKRLSIKNVPGNVGVQGRNSDNELIYKTLGWRPTQRVYEGLKKTYEWIYKQING